MKAQKEPQKTALTHGPWLYAVARLAGMLLWWLLSVHLAMCPSWNSCVCLAQRFRHPAINHEESSFPGQVYLTSYFSTWRVFEDAVLASPRPLMQDALEHFYQKPLGAKIIQDFFTGGIAFLWRQPPFLLTRMRRLPDTVVIYRGGASDSQQASLLELWFWSASERSEWLWKYL